MIEVVNRQRKMAVDIERWQAFSERALKSIRKSESDATIAFVSDRQMKDLNKRFRNINRSTDVLSFPAEEVGAAAGTNLGDIAVSLERATTQAEENGLTLEVEIAQLILHGLLHLCGYDHETDQGQMNRLELQLRQKLGI
jgi:probable rRNA maturation factor